MESEQRISEQRMIECKALIENAGFLIRGLTVGEYMLCLADLLAKETKKMVDKERKK
jgi:hypothetical protein